MVSTIYSQFSKPRTSPIEGLCSFARSGSIHFPASFQLPRMRTLPSLPPFPSSDATAHCLSSHRPHLTPTCALSLSLSFQRRGRASWSAAAPPPTTPFSKLYPISSTRPSSPRYVRDVVRTMERWYDARRGNDPPRAVFIGFVLPFDL